MSRLKIGFVLDDSMDRPDGVQQYVLSLGHWLQVQGHEVHYLAGESSAQTENNVHSLSRNVQVRFNHNHLSIPLPASRQAIKELLGKEKYDVLHVQLPCSPWLAGRVVRAAAPETAVVGTFHVAPYSNLVRTASHVLGWYEHRLHQQFQAVISVSAAAQAFAKSAFHVASQVIPIGMDLHKYHQAQTKSKASMPTIIFLGRLVERKGCQQLLEAVAKLSREPNVKSFRVLVGGRGPLEASLQRYVNEHSLQDHVSFVGFIAEADKPQFLASSDIAVFPSLGGESFGIILLEAMAASRGVVLAGNNPGYAAVMSQREEQLFDPRDPSTLAGKLARYLEDEPIRQMAHDWQQHHVKQFSIDNVAPKVLEVYIQALRTRRDVR